MLYIFVLEIIISIKNKIHKEQIYSSVSMILYSLGTNAKSSKYFTVQTNNYGIYLVYHSQ